MINVFANIFLIKSNHKIYQHRNISFVGHFFKGKVKQLYFHFIKMRVSNTGSSFFALETIEGYFRCCGVLSRADYTVQSLGWCDAKEIHLEKCAPPASCCPSGLDCDMTESYEIGCVKKMAIWTSDNTATLAGAWVLIWLVIVFEIVAVAHSGSRRLE